LKQVYRKFVLDEDHFDNELAIKKLNIHYLIQRREQTNLFVHKENFAYLCTYNIIENIFGLKSHNV